MFVFVDWAGANMRWTFWKNVGFWSAKFCSLFCSANGVALGNVVLCRHVEKVGSGKWRWWNLKLLSDRFWNYFLEFPADFLCREGGSRRLSNPLSIYDQAPYFPEGSGPIFPHGPIFNSRSPAPGGRYFSSMCGPSLHCHAKRLSNGDALWLAGETVLIGESSY